MTKRFEVVAVLAMLVGAVALSAQSRPSEGSPLVGKKVPAATLKDFSGKTSTLASHLGTPTFVSFWASWCGPCLKEMPELNALLAKHPGKFQVLAIAMGDKFASAEAVMKARSSFAFSWLIDADPSATMTTPLGKAFDIIALPTAMWIGADGTVIDYWRGLPPGEGELTKKVEALLARSGR